MGIASPVPLTLSRLHYQRAQEGVNTNIMGSWSLVFTQVFNLWGNICASSAKRAIILSQGLLSHYGQQDKERQKDTGSEVTGGLRLRISLSSLLLFVPDPGFSRAKVLLLCFHIY